MPDIALPRQYEPSTVPVSPAADTLRPAQLLGLLRRNWPLLAVCGVLLGAAAYIGAKTLLPPKFSATGILVINLQSPAIPELEGALKGEVLPDPMPQVRSEVQELQSPTLIKTVINDLKLEQNPEFNPTLRPPGLMARIKSGIEAVLPAPLRNVAVTSGLLPDPRKAGPPSQSMVDDMTIGTVGHDLSVFNDGQSMVIRVQFMAREPKLAAAVVNSLIDHYLAAKKASLQQANEQANSNLTGRLHQVQNQIASLEQQIQQTRQQYQLVQTRAGSVSQQEVEDLSSALIHASDESAALQAQYARARVLARTGDLGEDSDAVLGSSTVGMLREEEAAAQRRVAQLETTYGPRYPEVRAAEAQLRSARGAISAQARRVLSGLGAQVQASQQHVADLRAQLAQEQSRASSLETVQAKLAQLQKDADARRSLYQSLLISAEQTQNTHKGLEQVDARVVSLATPPAFPASPRPKLAGALGLLSGVAFGGLLSLMRGTARTAFTELDDLEAETGLTALAAIPRLGHGRSHLLAHVAATTPSGPEAEALRLIRNKLRFAGRGPVPRTLLFASALPGEGSSSVAAAFARTAALDGLRVLLVETNLEQPALAKQLEVSPNNGVVETLLGSEHWRELVSFDRASTLEYLLADGAPQEAGRLLESMQLQNLLCEAREDYNFVVLDAQAVTTSTHSLVLAHMVDAVILVVEARVTSRGDVHAAIEALEGSSAQPPFVVLNKA